MNILFLSLGKYDSIYEHGIYTDLLREFITHENDVFILSPVENRGVGEIRVIHEKQSMILKVPTGRIQKTNIIEKGVNTVLIETRYKKAIKKYFQDIKFDLILYPTPPITLAGAVKYVKKRDGARSYLLLKDIFPQNAVDIGLMTKTGIKGFLYKYFRKKEKKLYAISDYIGCMSKANVDYVIKHNPEINPTKVGICPNCVEVRDLRLGGAERVEMRKKNDIPIDKKVFIYGGNLGKPQGIPFLIKCLEWCRNKKDAYFLIIGDGTEYGKLEAFFTKEKPENMKLMKRLPKEDYDRMVAACDVGMIFLDYRFTIPNFPSRLLSYLQAGLPVLACTDINTDIGNLITNGQFGWWCASNDLKAFGKVIEEACRSDLRKIGNIGYKNLIDFYNISIAYREIMEKMEK